MWWRWVGFIRCMYDDVVADMSCDVSFAFLSQVHVLLLPPSSRYIEGLSLSLRPKQRSQETLLLSPVYAAYAFILGDFSSDRIPVMSRSERL
jgi:hypothetical protein